METPDQAKRDLEREQAIRAWIRAARKKSRLRLTIAFLSGILIGLVVGLSINEARADVPLRPAEAVKIQEMTEAVCPLLETEAMEVQIIRDERANPSGVVDLRVLHEAGEILAQTKALLKYERKLHAEGLRLFRVWAHKPIDLAYCEAWERRQEAERQRMIEELEKTGQVTPSVPRTPRQIDEDVY